MGQGMLNTLDKILKVGKSNPRLALWPNDLRVIVAMSRPSRDSRQIVSELLLQGYPVV